MQEPPAAYVHQDDIEFLSVALSTIKDWLATDRTGMPIVLMGVESAWLNRSGNLLRCLGYNDGAPNYRGHQAHTEVADYFTDLLEHAINGDTITSEEISKGWQIIASLRVCQQPSIWY